MAVPSKTVVSFDRGCDTWNSNANIQKSSIYSNWHFLCYLMITINVRPTYKKQLFSARFTDIIIIKCYQAVRV